MARHPVLPVFILLLLAITAQAMDFYFDDLLSRPYINDEMYHYPLYAGDGGRNSAILDSMDNFVPTYTPPRVCHNLNGKALRLVYMAFITDLLKITLLQVRTDNTGVDSTSFHLSAWIRDTVSTEVIIPLSAFEGADLFYAYGVRIEGGFMVRRLELMDDPTAPRSQEPLDHTRSRLSQSSVYSALFNLNSLRLGRFVRGVAKDGPWVTINDQGFFHEDLVRGAETMDLTGAVFKIICSTFMGHTNLRLQLRYHSSPHLSLNAPTITATKELKLGRNNAVVFSVEDFPGIRVRDVKSLRIFGPVMIRFIELVRRPEALRDTLNQEETVLIDDLSTWTSTARHPVHAPPDTYDPLRYDLHGGLYPGFSRLWSSLLNVIPAIKKSSGPLSGINSINLPCEGQQAALTSKGVRLEKFGFIYEPLANPDTSPMDLTNAHIDFEYSACELVTSVIQVQCATETSGYLVQTSIMELPVARNRLAGFRVSQCGLSRAIQIAGREEITIHAINLRIPIPKQLGQFRHVVLDNFSNWRPISDSPIPTAYPRQLIKPITRAGTINPEPVVYNFLEPVLHRSPGYEDCDFRIGVGVVISYGGFWAQYLPESVGMFIKITYTSPELRTLKIVLTAVSTSTKTQRRTQEQIMHVVFNQGNSIDVHFPLPKQSSDNIPIAITGIRINGPVVIHQLKLLDTAPSPKSVGPGESSPDALLIDDFTDWSDDRLNSGDFAQDQPLPSIEVGSITIAEREEYHLQRIEDNPDALPIQHLSFRITYSIGTSASCKMALVPEIQDEVTKLWHPAINPTYSNVMFHAGSHNQLTIVMSDLLKNTPSPNHRFYSYHIQGPVSRSRDTMLPLILHKVEMTSAVPYSQFMVPDLDNIRSRLVNLYQVKLNAFKHELSLLQLSPRLDFEVRRDKAWEDAYRITEMTPVELQHKLNITFSDEIGQDAGGLTREFFSLIADHINKPDSDLFVSSADVDYALQINPNSDIQVENYLNYYKLVGRLIGMAILNESVINIRLVSLLYKKLISEPTEIRRNVPKLSSEDTLEVDMEALNEIEPELYTQLKWCLREDVTDLGLTMTLHANRGGKMETIELVENGSQYEVTQANKRQYVQKYAYWHTEIKVQAQANALRDGVWDVVPRWLLSKFTESELELLISGRKEINVNDWRTHTTLVGYHSEDPSILLFWECVQGMTNKKRSMLLRFVTGSPNVPAAGFPGLENKFTIVKVHLSNMHPKAQTCSNLLTLPPFTDPKVMCERLEIAILPETGQFSFI